LTGLEIRGRLAERVSERRPSFSAVATDERSLFGDLLQRVAEHRQD
jgi:hypothetical protein